MKGYIARDEDGRLFLYRHKPVRLNYVGSWTDEQSPRYERVHEDDYEEGYFKNVTWDGEPSEVEFSHDPVDGWLNVEMV